jgi:hypothetical protein
MHYSSVRYGHTVTCLLILVSMCIAVQSKADGGDYTIKFSAARLSSYSRYLPAQLACPRREADGLPIL